jgi:hypothetical protein
MSYGLIDENDKLDLDSNNEFVFHKSSCSFDIDEVESFLYGGIGSRFWIFRKHINSMDLQEIRANKMPFQAWDCITINLERGREINIVIKNEACMKALMMLLIYEMKTVDGKKNSGAKIIQAILDQQKDDLIKTEQQKLIETKHNLMVATIKKYNLIRIRIKLSYHSLVSRSSICEMFLGKILLTYRHFHGQPEILKKKDVID